MKNFEIKLNGQIKLDTVIWKYLNFSSFVSLFLEEKLVFRRVDLFADKLEGMPCELAKKEHLEFLTYKTEPEEALQMHIRELINIENHKKYTYANCWTIGNNENYALWKIYLSPEKNGVAIKTTIQNLIDSIIFSPSDLPVPQPILVKEVTYKEYGIHNLNQDTVFTTKNPEYEYEKELRLLIKNQRDFNKPKSIISQGYNDMQVHYIKVDLNKLIDKLYISPFSNEWFRNSVKKLIDLKNIEFNIGKLCISSIKE